VPVPEGGTRWSELASEDSDVIVISDLEGRPTFVSPAIRELLGYEPSQLLQVSGMTFIHEGDLPVAAEALQAVGQGRVVTIDHLRIAHASGFYVPLEVIGVPLFGEDGQVRSILVIIRDPGQKMTGDGGYEAAFQKVPVGLYSSRPDGKLIAANDSFVRMFGAPDRDSLLATSTLDLWADPSDREAFVDAMAREGEVRNLDMRARRLDGSTFWGRLNVRAVRGPEGTPQRYEGYIEDVSELKRTEEALRESEARYRQLVEDIPAVLYVAEPGRDGQWLYISPQIEDLLGYTQDQWITDRYLWDRCLHPEDGERVLALEEEMWRAVDEGARSPHEPFHMEYRMVAADGSEVYVRDEATVLPRPGAPPLLRGMFVDITREKRAEQALDLATKRTGAVIDAALDAIVLMDHKGLVVEFNPAAERIFGYGRNEVLGRPMADHLVPPQLRDRHLASVDRFLRTGEKRVMDQRVEMEAMRRDGTTFPAELVITTVKGAEPPVFVGFVRDITQQKRAKLLLEKRARELERSYEAVETLAKTDAMTGLPNRQALMQHLEQALARSQRDGSRVAVLFIDVDRFKAINDTLGHDGGDALLVQISSRLRHMVRQGDSLARLGGDEFIVVCEGVSDEAPAAAVAQRISKAMARPFRIAGRQVEASASVGIAMSSGPSTKPTDLLRDADAAMYQAKERGLGQWAFFDESASSHAFRREALLASLRGARMEEFEPHYQPIVALEGERVVGYEALARWSHPSRGLLSPGEFLDTAEETGLILEIGDHLLGRVCEDALRLLKPLSPEASVAVNLSARQLAQRDLADQVLGHIEGSGLQPHQLSMEITETASLRNADVAADSLRRLRSAGVRIAVDDFGIGYSSLLYLRMFPIDLVKIDRTFVQGVGMHVEDMAIVSAVSHMAQSLGMIPVAEGVETPEQRDAVRRAGCELAQGYLWGRPVPMDEALHAPG
jgi:diguanylate cyclase (GGDEF)-like protein/PAS domain S-box-containing protein